MRKIVCQCDICNKEVKSKELYKIDINNYDNYDERDNIELDICIDCLNCFKDLKNKLMARKQIEK